MTKKQSFNAVFTQNWRKAGKKETPAVVESKPVKKTQRKKKGADE